MPDADEANDEAAATAEPEAAVVVPPVEAVSAPTLKAEITALEASIAADQARLAALRVKRDFKEYPKAVKDQIFASREAQDAAGPEYAEI
jgi:hypothetical protein